MLVTNNISIFALKLLAMFKGINAIDFNKRFKNNDDCFAYLVQLKWPDGFSCSRYG